jgi:hypothetical protein
MLANPNVPSCNADGSTSPVSSAYWYGFGYQVNQYGNYWHTGSLPGTSTENVVANNKYSFAAFFNTRPQDANAFFSELDTELWTAFSGVSSWSERDYFAQYAPYEDWVDAAAFSERALRAKRDGEYASRAEGRLNDGVPQFRARFAQLDADRDVHDHFGLDCTAYQAAAAQYREAGLDLVSVQSFVDTDGISRYQATWAAE